MDESYLISRYLSAAEILPEKIRQAAIHGENNKVKAEEFRMRIGKTPTILTDAGEIPFGYEYPITRDDIDDLLMKATMGSVHSAAKSLRSGFVTAPGGHRVGICGEAVIEDEKVTGIRSINSVALRISKEIRGAAVPVYHNLVENGRFISTLILSPPGAGKTTLLRDIIRLASEDGLRVSVADERYELAGSADGRISFDLGSHTDVISGAPKAKAVMMLLRGMNPDVIAMDELTDMADADAAVSAYGCGVSLIGTIHSFNIDADRIVDMLAERPGGDSLLKVFDMLLFISKKGAVRQYKLHRLRI